MTVRPWVQLALIPKESMRFNFGSLDSTHNAHEFLLRRSRQFEQPVEEGMQLKYWGDFISADYWLNWKQMETTDRAESFEVGLITRLMADYVRGDLQLLAHHSDGQKTKGPTSLRNNVGLASLQLQWPLQRFLPYAGGRSLHSDFSLNDNARLRGMGSEVFCGIEIPIGATQSIESVFTSFSGTNLKSIDSLPLYNAHSFRVFEIKWSAEVAPLSRLKFRVSADQFHGRTHSSQEISLDMKI